MKCCYVKSKTTQENTMVLAQRPSGDLLLKYPYNNVVGHFYEPGNRTTI
ncbi:MAG TPA: hypothetical protein VF610_11335 [Segetibacter sp.]